MAERKERRLKKNRKDGKKVGCKWSEAKRVEAATTLLATGKVDITSKMTGIPEDTIQGWRRSPAFQALLEDVRNDNELQTESGLTKIIDKALGNVMTSLTEGDAKMDRNGKIHYVKPSAKDTAVIAAVSMDKRRLIQDKPTTKIEISMDDRLSKLADHFQQMGNSSIIDSTATEVLDAEDAEFEEIGQNEESN